MKHTRIHFTEVARPGWRNRYAVLVEALQVAGLGVFLVGLFAVAFVVIWLGSPA